MIIDCKSPEWQANPQTGRVFVDGAEILHAFYADTEAGIVKTYDVLGNGAYVQPYQVNLVIPLDWFDAGGVFAKTITGVVTFVPDPSREPYCVDAPCTCDECESRHDNERRETETIRVRLCGCADFPNCSCTDNSGTELVD